METWIGREETHEIYSESTLLAAELKNTYEEIQKSVAAKKRESEDAVKELSAEELDTVAGGAFPGFNDGDLEECWDTYRHQENCYLIDACDKLVNSYKGYMCARPSSCQKAYRGECNNLDYE